jgi:hypothetical protein
MTLIWGRREYFTVTCNDSFQPPKPMIGDPDIAVEVIDISLEHGEMCVYGGVSYSCFTSNTTMSDYDKTWFVFANTRLITTLCVRFIKSDC